MQFVDKNPEGTGDDEALEDEDEWEHRVIRNIVWWRHQGYAVETALRDTQNLHQSIERYQINDDLHKMIRDSPHNAHTMASQMPNTDTDAADAAPAPTSNAPTVSGSLVHI